MPANVRQNSDLSNRYQSNLYDGPESYNDENNPPSWADQADYDYESSRWIHRDKLAQIESEELRSAGIYVLPSERLEIDSGSLKRKRLSAGIYDNKDDQHQEESSDVQIFDLRTPEEIAADQMRLKNGSKIPLATTSPLPVPTEYVVRNTPLKRPQPSPESTPQTHTRKRSHSTGSNYLLDSSPIKSPVAVVAATPKSTVSTPASKKQTTPTPKGKQTPASLKKRTRSNPQLYGARPKTSSAAMPASPTHKEHFVPDGPPPWAVASYQPDPSLPPDQQIIPTVAKRLAQEKWEREGAFSDIYDRTLRPLRKLDIDNEGPKRRSQQSTKPAPEHLEPEPAPQPKRASYSTVPPVSSTPPVDRKHMLTLTAGTKAQPSDEWHATNETIRTDTGARSRITRTRKETRNLLLYHHVALALVLDRLFN